MNEKTVQFFSSIFVEAFCDFFVSMFPFAELFSSDGRRIGRFYFIKKIKSAPALNPSVLYYRDVEVGFQGGRGLKY